MLTPEQFKRACGNLGGIVNKQVAISAKANFSDKNSIDALNDAGKQLNEDTLRVLVMGRFSSGKSTFFNTVSGVYDVTLGTININGVNLEYDKLVFNQFNYT